MALHSCGISIRDMLKPGVSNELAQYRKKFITHVAYELTFRIPEQLNEPITGKANIHFHMSRAQRGMVLDFQGGADKVHRVTVNGQEENYQVLNGHIILSSKNIIPTMNSVEIDFTSTDQAMNRSEEFMYTLFVPDRASTAFPCFVTLISGLDIVSFGTITMKRNILMNGKCSDKRTRPWSFWIAAKVMTILSHYSFHGILRTTGACFLVKTGICTTGMMLPKNLWRITSEKTYR